MRNLKDVCRLIILMAVSAAAIMVPSAFQGCTVSDLDTVRQDNTASREDTDGEKVTVRFRTLVPSEGTRAQETETENILVSVYDDGALMETLSLDGDRTGEIELEYGKFYRYYASANITMDKIPSSEDDMLKNRISVSPSEPAGGFPMSASGGFTVTGDGIIINITLQRLYAKIGLSVDLSDVPDLEITSACIRQAATSVMLFESSKAVSVGTGDEASAAEVRALNGGSEIDFYIPENCQGVLLPDNTSSGEKIPDNIPGKSGLCTYMEIKGKFSGEDLLNGDITYRFYLGEDATSDFNVKRNTDSNIRLVPSKDAVTEPSWQVDADVYAVVGSVMAGNNGNIYCHTSGKITTVRTDNTVSWVKIIRGNGLYVAAGNSSYGKYANIWISSDGLSWQEAMSSSACAITDIAYGNGKFVAVTGEKTIFISQGGSIWQSRSVSMNAEIVGFGAGKFVAATDLNAPYSSADGITWKRCSGNILYASMLEYGDNKFTGIGGSGWVSQSADGSTWTTSRYSFDTTPYTIDDMAYGNGVYVLGTENAIYYSADGISWKSADLSSSCYNNVVDFKDGVFCAASYMNGGGTCISTSLDGIHWTQIWSAATMLMPEEICILD